MHFPHTRMIICAFLILFFGLPAIVCQAAGYPSKPITLLVGYAPGGGTDLAARLISGYFSKKWGQQILVVNKPGGNVVPCVVEMHKAKPDGYTLMVDTNGASSIQTAIMKNLPFKLEDRIFITNFLINPTFYFCATSKPFKNLKEVAEYVKRDPANFKWAALDISSTTTFSQIQFLDVIGVDVLKTKKMDFKGGPEVMVADGERRGGPGQLRHRPCFAAHRKREDPPPGPDLSPAPEKVAQSAHRQRKRGSPA